MDSAEIKPNGAFRVLVNVANTGARDGDEVVQVYFRHVKSAVPQPNQALVGFQRVPIQHGRTAQVEIPVPAKELRYWDVTRKQYVIEPGDYQILIGAASDDIRATLPLRVAL